MPKLRSITALLRLRGLRWTEIAVCGLLPGALAGTQIAGLLFFLNPALPFGAAPVIRLVALYALPIGALGLLLQLPWTWKDPRRARRLLPWGLTAALLLASFLDWTHAAYFSYYLPPGINVRLLKAASLLTLAALIAFYTALLHTLHRRRYGRRSVLGFVFLCLASVYVMVERREAFRPEPVKLRESASTGERPRPRLIVVGLEAASLDVILPLAEEGRLPFLATVLRQGASGRLESLTPYRRAPLWTSLATGKFPYRHEIQGETAYRAGLLGEGAELRLLPVRIGFASWGTAGLTPRRVDRADLRALTLWQILGRLGIPSGVVGWPLTAPVPEELAFCVSERFFSGSSLRPSSAPEALTERARLFRVGVEELDPQLLATFGSEPPYTVLDALADDVWRETLSAFLQEHQREAEALFIVLPGLRKVSRRYFGGFASSELGGSVNGAETQAAAWVEAYYTHLDAFLADLWARESGNALLAVVSPSGVRQRPSWHRLLRLESQQSRLEGSFAGSPDGALLLYGPGIRPGTRLTGARVLDVAPTLLYALGFPIARDLDGKVLTPAFEPELLEGLPLRFVPSYEALPVGGLSAPSTGGAG